jgi:hypothetical protein
MLVFRWNSGYNSLNEKNESVHWFTDIDTEHYSSIFMIPILLIINFPSHNEKQRHLAPLG